MSASDTLSSPWGEQEESQAGRARTWTSRACDRCRKRKARCDEAVPCRTCSEAGAECTHNAPTKKRGPKPRPRETELEQRLRTLEHLISSVPPSSSSGQLSTSLTLAEVHEIRQAAGGLSATPILPSGHDASEASNWDAERAWEELCRQAEANAGESSTGAGQRSQDLLYKDQEGQTRYLGASSGMPLLDKLRVTTQPPSTFPSTSPTAQGWISLSAALGLEAEPWAQLQSPSVPIDESWSRLTSVIPQDLVDSLVRSYFTISHLLWPILHAPTFTSQYQDPSYRQDPSFCFLVMSICCLSSRYAHDERLGGTAKTDLIAATKDLMRDVTQDRSDLFVVQGLFNMSVVQEGTNQPGRIWQPLTQALSMAFDIGLHRRADDWSAFSVIDVEVRKRTMWAIYCLHINASTTYGRPPMISFRDLDLDEPSIVDDAYISLEMGVGVQPSDRPSVIAGLVAAARLHIVLEQTISRINRGSRQIDSTSFIGMASTPVPSPATADITNLASLVTASLPGDWTFSPAIITDPDNVRFFQRTRVFALQQFIRLLIGRHDFGLALERGSPSAEEVSNVVTPALQIIGAYCTIDSRGRLGFFGAHAIAQLTQAGTGLIGVLLHLKSTSDTASAQHHLALQGLPACVQTLSRLGTRRPAGVRAAQVLAEFAKACQIPVFTQLGSGEGNNEADVVVPMLRSLPRKDSIAMSGLETAQIASEQFDFGGLATWLNAAGSSHGHNLDNVFLT